MEIILLLAALLPVVCGVLLLALKFFDGYPLRPAVLVVLALVLVLVISGAVGPRGELQLLHLGRSPALTVYFRADGLGLFFAVLASVMWLLSGLFAQEYMAHEEDQRRYYGFLLLTEGALLTLCFAGNYLTLYLGFEFMTILSVPLVLHTQTEAARQASFKYLLYSVFGACLGLAGFFTIYTYGATTVFTPGGVLDPAKSAGNETLLQVVAFLSIMGFGAKAGMFPLQAWLPTAHPEAPAPASALLSGVITKAGVLSIIRVVYYQFGANFLRNTWVQYAWLALALCTVLMGSMLAYKENLFKKRLAYSTVSQVSYVLFGLALMQKTAFIGALLHVVYHSVIKDGLFFTAGAIICRTGRKTVDQYRGIGKEMPITMWCFTICSLGLVGIPPLGGFVSKWYLAMGSLNSGLSVVNWLGPVILLASALLTAGYLFSITIQAFFPGASFHYDTVQRHEPTAWMVLPLVVLAAATLLLGLLPQPLLQAAESISGTLFQGVIQ